MRDLSPEEQQVSQERDHHTPDAMIKTRCQILLLSAQRPVVPQIARVTFTSEETVARCIHEFNRSGLEGILPAERVGRPARITQDILKRLPERMESDPRDMHSPFSTWTAELLALTLKEQSGVVVMAPQGSSHGASPGLHRWYVIPYR